jgi:hypothetical protein
MLLPVSLAGVLASIVQILTGRKAAFARTPKVAGRTAVHPVYIVFNAGMFVLMLNYTVGGIRTGDLLGTVVPAMNVVLYGYGLQRFIGLKDGLADLLRPAARGALALLGGLAGQLGFGPRPLGAFSVTRTAVAAVLALIATLVPVSFRTSTVAADGAVSEAVAGTPAPAVLIPVTATLRLERTADPELSAQGGKLE